MNGLVLVVGSFVAYFVLLWAYILLERLLRFGGNRPTASTDEPRALLRYLALISVIMAAVQYAFSSLSARHTLTGYAAVQVTLGTIVGLWVFGPLTWYFVQKLRISPIFYILAGVSAVINLGPMLVTGIMELLGLSVSHVYPFVHE